MVKFYSRGFVHDSYDKIGRPLFIMRSGKVRMLLSPACFGWDVVFTCVLHGLGGFVCVSACTLCVRVCVPSTRNQLDLEALFIMTEQDNIMRWQTRFLASEHRRRWVLCNRRDCSICVS